MASEEKELNENSKLFSLKNLWPFGAHLVVATFYVSSILGRIQRLEDKIDVMKEAQVTDHVDNKNWHTITEADMASLKVRMALVEQANRDKQELTFKDRDKADE